MEARLLQRVAALLTLLAVVFLQGAHDMVFAQDEGLRAPDVSGPFLEPPPQSTFQTEPVDVPAEAPFGDAPVADAPAADAPVVSEPLTGEPSVAEPVEEPGSPAPVTEPAKECLGCRAGGYWIVSSRHCSSHKGAGKPECGLIYYHIGFDRKIRVYNEQTFLGALEPGRPVCIMVHGSFHSWESVVLGSWELHKWLAPASSGAGANLVFFTWPSDKPNTLLLPLDFAILGRRAEFHGAYLSELIAKIPADRPLGLMGHSHGARTVSAVLQLRAGGDVDGVRFGRAPDFDRRIRVVFAAAAIDSDWLNPGHRFGLALTGTEYLLNLRNRDDAALALYPYRRIFSGDALGRTGITPNMRRQLGALAGRVGELDVTRQIGSGHMLYNYVEHPEIAQSIAQTLFYLDGQPTIQPQPEPVQAAKQTEQMSYTVPQRKPAGPAATSNKRVRETFSNVGRNRPVGRL